MLPFQPGIMENIPSTGRYVSFTLNHDANPEQLIKLLPDVVDVATTVTGIGIPLVTALGADIPGLTIFPSLAGRGIAIPATQTAMWCWLRGEDRGELVHKTLALENRVSHIMQVSDIIDAFRYKDSRDLTGYVDGTENPRGDDAESAALLTDGPTGIKGSSFVAVQQWVHDLDYFHNQTQDEQDYIIGRRKSDNEEIDEAPVTAHVKRTAQESFDPAAFIVRRSMPWCDADGQGLVFVAFGNSFAAFEALLKRMIGLTDEHVDSLFRFSRPITGSYYWCPPVKNGKLDLSALIAS